MDPLTIIAIKRLAPYVIGCIAVVGFLTYMHHSIYQEGYDDAKTKYEARDTKATAEALGILAESKRINDNQFDKDKTDYENRIKDLTDKLATDNTTSLPIRTKGPKTCGTGKTDNIKGNGGGVEENGVAELATYNRRLLNQVGTKINAMARELLVCSENVSETYILK